MAFKSIQKFFVGKTSEARVSINRRKTFPIIRFMNVKLKMTYHDNLFAFSFVDFTIPKN